MNNGKFTKIQICKIFQVSPRQIGDLRSTTFYNFFQRKTHNFIVDVIRPWLKRIE